jgi:hypothetical protein
MISGPYALFIDDSQYNLVSHSHRVLPIKASLPRNIYDDETQKQEFSKYERTYMPNKDFRKLYMTVKNSENYNLYMKGGMTSLLMRKIIRYIKSNPVKFIFLDWDFTIQRNNGTPLNENWEEDIKLSTILREHHTNLQSYLEFIIGKKRLPVLKKMLRQLKNSGVRIIILTANGIPTIKGGKKFMSDVLNKIADDIVINPKDVYYSEDKQKKIDNLLRKFDRKLYEETKYLTKEDVKNARKELYRPFTKTKKIKRKVFVNKLN